MHVVFHFLFFCFLLFFTLCHFPLFCVCFLVVLFCTYFSPHFFSFFCMVFISSFFSSTKPELSEPIKSNPPRSSKSNLMASSLPSKSPAAPATVAARVEVSPYRRWSETSVDQKVSNEWQSNFERSYIELEELGRGRFSVVRRCQEIMSGNEVAVKFVNRRKQNEPDTLREYRHLATIKNPHLISSFGLYLTSNSYAIVMTL